MRAPAFFCVTVDLIKRLRIQGSTTGQELCPGVEGLSLYFGK